MNPTNDATYGNWKKNVSLFLGSQFISMFGSSLVQYAVMWYITLNTQSGVMMTIYILCGFLPTFLLSPFSGVWADRYNRKKLIILADAMIALVTLILAIIFLSGYDAFWLLFVICAIRAVGTGIQMPAVGAIIPQMVPEEHLTKVNGINGSMQAMVMLISPMVSAALLSFTTIELIFFIDVITAAIAIFILMKFLSIKVHAKAIEKQKFSYYADLKVGLIYINNHSFLKVFFLFFALFFILAAPVSFLTPLQVTRSFGADIWRLTVIEVTFSVGMMFGGILVATLKGFKNKIFTMTLSSVIFGICTFALGLIPVFWIYALVMGIIGVAMPFFNTPSTVLLQEKVEENYLGRVFGVLTMISTSMMPLGMLIFGPISDVIAIEFLLIGTGIVMFILSFFLIGNKALVRAGAPEKQ